MSIFYWLNIMTRLVFDRSDEVMKFVAGMTGEDRYDNCTTIGLERDGHIVAGVLYQGHNGPNVLMHFSRQGSRHLLTRAFVCAAFMYPFQVLGCNRVTGLVRLDNLDAQRLDEHLGFVREGIMRQGARDGTDFILYGMLRRECRFLHGRYLKALLSELDGRTDGFMQVSA
jgi:RimJ/RimL family protein N-acetyltransferase